MTISHQINPVFINPARLSTTSCQYIITYNAVFIDPAWLCTKSPAYIWIAPSELCAYKSLGILFKSLIANMAGFLLWLSITRIMIKVFKVALAQWLLYYQWI